MDSTFRTENYCWGGGIREVEESTYEIDPSREATSKIQLRLEPSITHLLKIGLVFTICQWDDIQRGRDSTDPCVASRLHNEAGMVGGERRRLSPLSPAPRAATLNVILGGRSRDSALGGRVKSPPRSDLCKSVDFEFRQTEEMSAQLCLKEGEHKLFYSHSRQYNSVQLERQLSSSVNQNKISAGMHLPF